MSRRLFFTLLIALSVTVPQIIAIGPSASAVNLFPSAACKSQSDLNESTTVCQQNSAQGGTKSGNPIIGALQITITILSLIVGVSAVIVIMISGIRMITANGDSQSFARARSSVIYALVALVIAGLAETIVAFVLSRL